MFVLAAVAAAFDDEGFWGLDLHFWRSWGLFWGRIGREGISFFFLEFGESVVKVRREGCESEWKRRSIGVAGNVMMLSTT